MSQIVLEVARKFVKRNIGLFHDQRLESLKSLKLSKILQRKNPYLFKSKNILTSEILIKTLLDAHLSSQEETIFGDFLEKLAIFIAQNVFEGKKSSAEGIDLEFDREDEYEVKYCESWVELEDYKRRLKKREEQGQRIKPIRNFFISEYDSMGNLKLKDILEMPLEDFIKFIKNQ